MKKRYLSLPLILVSAPLVALSVSCGTSDVPISKQLDIYFEKFIPVIPLPSPKLTTFELLEIPSSGKLTQQLVDSLGILFTLPPQSEMKDMEFLYRLVSIPNDINNDKATFEFIIQLASTTDLDAISTTVKKIHVYSSDDRPTYSMKTLTRADVTNNPNKYIKTVDSKRTVNWEVLSDEKINVISENAFAIIDQTATGGDDDSIRRIDELVVPSFIVEIKDSAFKNNSITSLDMSQALMLKRVGNEAFKNNDISTLIIKESENISIGNAAFEANALEQMPDFGDYSELYKPYWNKFKSNYFAAKDGVDILSDYLSNGIQYDESTGDEINRIQMNWTATQFDAVITGSSWATDGAGWYSQRGLSLAQFENVFKISIPNRNDVVDNYFKDITFDVQVQGGQSNNLTKDSKRGIRRYDVKVTMRAGNQMKGANSTYSNLLSEILHLYSLPEIKPTEDLTISAEMATKQTQALQLVTKEIQYINNFTSKDVWIETEVQQMRNLLNWYDNEELNFHYDDISQLSKAIPVRQIFSGITSTGYKGDEDKKGIKGKIRPMGISKLGFGQSFELTLTLTASEKYMGETAEEFHTLTSRPLYLYGFDTNKYEHIYAAAMHYGDEIGLGKYTQIETSSVESILREPIIVQNMEEYSQLIWEELKIIDIATPQILDNYKGIIDLKFSESLETDSKIHTTLRYLGEEVYDYAFVLKEFSDAFVSDLDDISSIVKETLEKRHFSVPAIPKKFNVSPNQPEVEVDINRLIGHPAGHNVLNFTGAYKYKVFYINTNPVHDVYQPLTLKVVPYHNGKAISNKAFNVTLPTPNNGEIFSPDLIH